MADQKPKSLEFRIEDDKLLGADPATGTEYWVRWVGNGAYSHYWLNNVENPTKASSPGDWYVYEDRGRDPLFRSIRDAEMKLVYKSVRCRVCEQTWVGKTVDMCVWCLDRKRRTEEDRQKRLTAKKVEWLDDLLTKFDQDPFCAIMEVGKIAEKVREFQ